MQDPRLPEPDIDDRERPALDLREMGRVLLKHRWSILALTALVTLIGALLVYRQTPVYRATATLLVERSPVQFAPVQDPYAAYTDAYLYYQTQYEMIKRRAIGERVVRKLGLDEPPPRATGEDARTGWRALLPESWRSPPPPPPTAEERFQRAVDRVVGAISVSPRRNSQLVDVHVMQADPRQAARIANAVAEAFIEDNLEGRLQMTQQAAAYLTGRLEELRGNLERSEQALQAFRDQENLVDVGGIDRLAGQELTLATGKLASTRRERADAELLVEQIREARAAGEQDRSRLAGLLENAEVQQASRALSAARGKVRELATRYGPLHPRMIAAEGELEAAREGMQRQIELAAAAADNRLTTAQEAERRAQEELDRLTARMREIDRKEFNLQTLEREVETNRQIFEKFQTQFKETDAAGGVQSANARIVQAARVPGAPVKPDKRRAVLLSLLLGLALAVGLAFLLEHLDNTLKGADDVERRLGLPVLGVLPQLKTRGSGDIAPLRHVESEPHSAFAEAVRTIRTGVLLSALDEDHRILMVTSSVPGEGKTTLSMNLARSLADMKSVLLVDADMRRPMIENALDETAQVGLSHFIAGEAELAACIHQRAERLFVMHAGVVPPNPLELLSSRRFATALDDLAGRFDHIILDCAPALAVSDAMVLSKLATAVLYVVRSDATPAQAAADGIKRLRRAGANVIGAVINRAQRKGRLYAGRYASYYGDSYYADYGYVGERRAGT